MTMSLELWQGKSATVGGMLLVDDCDILDQAERANILAQLPPLDGMDILELGAGIGRYTSHFVQAARHVIAVDFVEKFLEENRRATAHFNNALYYCADVMDMEFEDGSFDFVFINWLLMYLDDSQIILLRDRIHRWARVGGKIFFRESCFVGSSGTAFPKDSPTRYRSDEEYMRLFESDFSLLHRGNVKIYEEPFNNPHQYFWLYQR
ncbi:methyltransferase domain-containing protein [Chloroflexota bacterium]